MDVDAEVITGAKVVAIDGSGDSNCGTIGVCKGLACPVDEICVVVSGSGVGASAGICAVDSVGSGVCSVGSGAGVGGTSHGI